MSTQNLIAYGIIAGVAVLLVPYAIITLRRRKREKLRRRGIKTYEHRGRV